MKKQTKKTDKKMAIVPHVKLKRVPREPIQEPGSIRNALVKVGIAARAVKDACDAIAPIVRNIRGRK